jgi:DNA replication protein DnaC
VLLGKLSRIDVLVIDDWAMAPLNETERRDFGEICEDRYQTRSMILTSQMPVAARMSRSAIRRLRTGLWTNWCITPIASKIKGDSMRKKRGGGGVPAGG